VNGGREVFQDVIQRYYEETDVTDRVRTAEEVIGRGTTD
jgi:hypothetical protein